MEAQKDVERDWSALPPEVLNLIAKNLYEIIDFVRFRAVCIAWRFSTPVTDLTPQFPWICEDRFNIEETYQRFFAMPSNKIYTVHVAKFMNKMIGQPCDGYFLTRIYDNNDCLRPLSGLSLINPLNNDEIPLPVPARGNDMLIWCEHVVNQTGEHVVSCAFCSQLHSEIEIVVCRLGQEYWCELKLDFDFMKCNHFFLKNMFFSVEGDTGVTKVTDITSGTIVYVVPPSKSHLTISGEFIGHSGKFRIVEVSGNIFGVFVCHEPSDFLYDVHHLDMTNRDFPCWVKVKTIGDYAIFFDNYSCVVLKANDLAGIEANCIYLLKIKHVRLYDGSLHEVKKINIETGAKEYIRCPFTRKGGMWFVPNLQRCAQ